jgi:hypothetical protein
MQTRQSIHQTLIDAAPTLIPLLPASLAEAYTTAMMGGSIASCVFREDEYVRSETPAGTVRKALLFLRDHDRYEGHPLFPEGAQGLASVEYYIKKAINQATQK